MKLPGFGSKASGQSDGCDSFRVLMQPSKTRREMTTGLSLGSLTILLPSDETAKGRIGNGRRKHGA